VHTIDISIGGNDHLVIAQILQILLNSEGGLDKVKFLIFINNLTGKTKGIEGFTL
jgi:hypothetical protein